MWWYFYSYNDTYVLFFKRNYASTKKLCTFVSTITFFLFLAMQEEVLKLVLLALEDGSALSRKVLVMFVVQRLEPHFPQASKTSIGHVVQLLYRASCFKVIYSDNYMLLSQMLYSKKKNYIYLHKYRIIYNYYIIMYKFSKITDILLIYY